MFYMNKFLKDEILEQPFEFMPESATQRKWLDVDGVENFWRFVQQPLVRQLFIDKSGVSMVNAALYRHEHLYLVGPVRLRMQRRKEVTCQHKSTALTTAGAKCYSDEDTSDFGGFTYNPSLDYWSFRGRIDNYNEGGYATLLRGNASEVQDQITALMSSTFIDTPTKAVFVEFNVYSPDLNCFSVVKLLAEFPLIGGIVPTFTFNVYKPMRDDTPLDSVVLAAQILFALWFLLAVVHHIVICVKGPPPVDPNKPAGRYTASLRLKEERGCCFRVWLHLRYYCGDGFLIVQNFILICVGVAIAIHVIHTLLMKDFVKLANSSTMSEYFDLYKLFYWQSLEDKTLMVVGFLLFIKTIKYLSVFPKVYAYLMSIVYTSTALVAFLVIWVFVSLAMASLSHMMFRYNVANFYTIENAFFLNFLATFGNLDFDAWQSSDLYFARIFYVLYMSISTIFLLNLIIALFSDSFGQAKAKIALTLKDRNEEIFRRTPKVFRSLYNKFFDDKDEGDNDSEESMSTGDDHERMIREEIGHQISDIYHLQTELGTRTPQPGPAPGPAPRAGGPGARNASVAGPRPGIRPSGSGTGLSLAAGVRRSGSGVGLSGAPGLKPSGSGTGLAGSRPGTPQSAQAPPLPAAPPAAPAPQPAAATAPV